MKKVALLLLSCMTSLLSTHHLLLKESSHPLIDKSNMFNAIYTFPDQIAYIIDKLGKKIPMIHSKNEIQNVVFAGMGGSAIGGDTGITLCKNSATIPMVTNRNYTLPNWVNKHTLVILLSYSGNTEETISCMHEAFEKEATVVGITSGGVIEKTLSAHNCPVIRIPGGMLPRAAFGYLVTPVLYILEQLDEIDPLFEIHLKNLVKSLTHYRDILSDENNSNNFAYKIAKQIIDTTPLIYAEAGTTEVVARRLHAQLAENSKIIASTHLLPEHSHNEIVTWQNHSLKSDKFGIIWLLDSDMHTRNDKRCEITRSIIDENIAYQKIIKCSGQTFLERIFFSLYIVDWISYWAAIHQGIDPSPIDNIVQLKNVMSEKAVNYAS